MNKYKTHSCGELTEKDAGKRIKIAGWVDNIRDLGGITFIDIRDQERKDSNSNI